MNWLIGAGIILLVLALIYFGISLVAALTLTKIGDHPQYDQTPASFGVEYQSVHFLSRIDKKKIAAWFLPKPDSEHCVLMVHGRNASKQNAISGRLPELAAELHKQGFAVLMIDLRGHGESEGKRYTWGEYERRDVLGGVDFLLGEGFNPGKIAVMGISLGGAAAVGAAAYEKSIGALICDSTFADLMALVEPNWVVESHLPMFFLAGVHFMWGLIYGIDLKKVKPIEDLKRVPPRPILIMHSTSDEIIDIEQAKSLAEAVPSVELVIFENCDHAELYRDDSEKYLETVVSFLKEKWISI
ncbi:MAG TPA: dipeptidyl aminopeptidase [Anaerolineaceae bacterium]|nr:MAG: Dipeptidyl aminopeptidase/acylaminoacyl-peptidase-like protein [Anaerolineaceae bacterium 46_22]HAF48356.1 dipeptidyl aminopeptidase [Anaerolineaceae bacterium]